MNIKERAQLVALLRRAARIVIAGDRSSALGVAAGELGLVCMSFLLPITGDKHWVSLLRGRGPVQDRETPERWHICGEGYEFALLDAATRVEIGAWPPIIDCGELVR